MKRKLSALRQRTEKNQDKRGEVERMRPDRGAGCEHPIEVVAADDMAEHQDAGEQAKSAGCRDGQRHTSAVSRLPRLMPVADQQKGKEAGQFPEEDQLNQIA